ncbi:MULTISPECIES: aspartate/glutamate/uridylate kinase [Desulfococcus]|uniref:Aspartate/glutamate/uridylate kinase n=1 Tax=Desulfococcus multivorans DSM 2059 TaxID=1121405 RepID=S7VFE8_DESML|nr:aspartate/glutamate/uridylate kinase [Desulfococcus multivorans]AOY58414.1 putative uridylyltransferase [Desulfococcus multivorans]AQV00738.1 uridine kinase [Desulfococcus multivorans]EPR43203.1 aspartate/glutamate/uridylate kinase [Desulfococcus multivorans DSM 2059]SJZ40127.1 molybdenum storage protein [Desulfococcus multivorans DSM 2059]
MAKLIKEEPDKGRLHIDSPLMGESLVSKKLLERTEAAEYFRMHPDINVIKIGGQSIMDRGRTALLPILDVLIKAKDNHKILLMTGGGTRARHVYNIGVDLGMPTGVLSKLGDKVSWQNAEMLSVLLAKHGGVKIGHGDNLEQLTMFCRLGYIPITYGIPPYGFFEHPAEFGSIPPHRTDCGAFLLAENIGARSLIFLKDEKGLFDKDPKKINESERGTLEFFKRISARELMALDLDDLIVERPVLSLLQRSKCLKELQIIDALRHPEYILDALEGKHVGTIIYKD